MKLVFLGTSFSIIYFMRFHRVVRNTYDKEQDTFRVLFLIVPCAVLALVINQERSALEVRGYLLRHKFSLGDARILWPWCILCSLLGMAGLHQNSVTQDREGV